MCPHRVQLCPGLFLLAIIIIPYFWTVSSRRSCLTQNAFSNPSICLRLICSLYLEICGDACVLKRPSCRLLRNYDNRLSSCCSNYFEADIRRCRWLGILGREGWLAPTRITAVLLPASSSFHPRPGSARSLWLLGTRASWRRLSPTQGTQLPYPA